MAKNFNELRAKMSPERRARNDKAIKEAIAAMPLDKMRKARNMTQVAVAEKLHVDQASVSKLENRTDIYLSTLREYVEALGGELVLRAEFPEGSFNIDLSQQV
jgi:predicted XRE-type DNA-binding protein